MMKQQNGWREVRLGEIYDVRDGTHDSPKQPHEGKYLITSRHIKNGKIDFSNAYKISGQQGSKGKGKRARPDLAATSRVVETVTVSEVTTCPSLVGRIMVHSSAAELHKPQLEQNLWGRLENS